MRTTPTQTLLLFSFISYSCTLRARRVRRVRRPRQPWCSAAELAALRLLLLQPIARDARVQTMITPPHPLLIGITPPHPGITPPHPHLAAPVLAAAAKLTFLVTLRERSAELGVMVDASGAIHHLTVQGGETDGTWTLVPVVPEDFGHFLLSRDTFEILHRGTLNKDGSITLDGQSYRIRAAINGGRLTARTILLDDAAP